MYFRHTFVFVTKKRHRNIESLPMFVKQLQLWSGGLGRSVASLKSDEVSSYFYINNDLLKAIHNYYISCGVHLFPYQTDHE